MALEIRNLFKNLKHSEIAFLESQLDSSLFESNKLLHNELDSVIFMYDSVERLNGDREDGIKSSPSLPPLLSNTKEKVLLCTNIINLYEELKKLEIDVDSQVEKNIIKFCYKLTINEKENDELETPNINIDDALALSCLTDTDVDTTSRASSRSLNSRPNTNNSSYNIIDSRDTQTTNKISQIDLPNQDLKSTIANSISNSRTFINLDMFIDRIDEITKDKLAEIENLVTVENGMIKDQIQLINGEIESKLRGPGPGAVGAGSRETQVLEKENMFSLDFLKSKLRLLEKIHKNKKSLSPTLSRKVPTLPEKLKKSNKKPSPPKNLATMVSPPGGAAYGGRRFRVKTSGLGS